MADDSAKKGKEMPAAGGAASETPRRELERATDTKLVPMGQSKHASQRRSQRVFLRTSVVIYGRRPDGTIYSENTQTVIVSANGALVLLAGEFQLKDRLFMMNDKTSHESECYVASFGELKEGKREVGIGFMDPAPKFWGINFPPDDWDPAMRKKPTGKTP